MCLLIPCAASFRSGDTMTGAYCNDTISMLSISGILSGRYQEGGFVRLPVCLRSICSVDSCTERCFQRLYTSSAAPATAVITSPICAFIFSSLRIEPFPFKLNNTQIKKFSKKRISNFWSPRKKFVYSIRLP